MTTTFQRLWTTTSVVEVPPNPSPATTPVPPIQETYTPIHIVGAQKTDPPAPPGWPTWRNADGNPIFCQPFDNPHGTVLTPTTLPSATPPPIPSHNKVPECNMVPMDYLSYQEAPPVLDRTDPLDGLFVKALHKPTNQTRFYSVRLEWFKDISGTVQPPPPTDISRFTLVADGSPNPTPGDCTEVQKQLDAAKIALAQAQQQAQQLQAQNATLQTSVTQTQTALTKANTDKAALQTTVTGLQGQVTSLQSQLANCNTSGPKVLSCALINADTNAVIAGYEKLADDFVLDLSALPTRNLNILAVTEPATAGSVKWQLDGAPLNIDNSAPYALQSSVTDSFTAWTPTVGSHVLTVTGFVEPNAQGNMGPTKLISFRVVEAPNGLTGAYFNSTNLSGIGVGKIDKVIDLKWNDGVAPVAGVKPAFSARWRGKLVPNFSEDYTFYTQNDDGVRLWINNELVIDDWNSHASQEKVASKKLTLKAGQRYDVKLEYFNSGGPGNVKLSWSSPSQGKQTIPSANLYSK